MSGLPTKIEVFPFVMESTEDLLENLRLYLDFVSRRCTGEAQELEDLKIENKLDPARVGDTIDLLYEIRTALFFVKRSIETEGEALCEVRTSATKASMENRAVAPRDRE